jgi:hypothetical protein
MTDDKAIVTIELDQVTASCFVIMPFSPIYQTLYERVIRIAVENAGLTCIRADEVFSKAQVTHEIWKQIRSSRLVLAELTGKNPNVLYELGLAHAIGKPSIIITRNQDDVPFDLRALRYLYYNTDDPFWGESLRQQLTQMCRKVIEQSDFGSVFEGITLQGVVKISAAVPQVREQLPLIDLTGVWRGTAKYIGRPDHSWNLHIAHTNNQLYGTAVISYLFMDKLTVVQQTVVGEIIGKNVSFHGVSYSFLERGNDDDYSLDSFQGMIQKDGKSIQGNVNDPAQEHTGLVLNRVIVEQ